MKKKLLLAILIFAFTFDVAIAQTEDKPPQSEREKADSVEQETTDEPKQADDSNKNSDAEEKKKNQSKRRNRKNSFSKKNDAFVSVFKTVIGSSRDSVVEVINGKKQIALGTVVGSDGLVLTKASELKGDVKCKLANGTLLSPEVVGIDPDTDLVLLKLNIAGLAMAQFDDSESPEVGSWIVTVDQAETPLSVGIVSHKPRKIKNNVPNSAVIGIYPRDRSEGEGVRINQVLDDTPAEKSGLLVNDVIKTIDGEEIENIEKLRQKLSEYQPGDEIKLEILRGKEELEISLTLGRSRVNPMMDRGNRQNRMGSILSKRRSDFPLALQHDSSLNANECGGPVVNIDGKVVGVNIARDGRVSTLVLPNSIVLPIIARLKTGEYSPEVVNQERIERVKNQLAVIESEIGDLPKQKTRKDIEFSAGAAIESEIAKQIKDLESRLKKLKERQSEQKEANREIGDSVTEIRKKLEDKSNKREQLNFELRRLKTGIR